MANHTRPFMFKEDACRRIAAKVAVEVPFSPDDVYLLAHSVHDFKGIDGDEEKLERVLRELATFATRHGYALHSIPIMGMELIAARALLDGERRESGWTGGHAPDCTCFGCSWAQLRRALSELWLEIKKAWGLA